MVVVVIRAVIRENLMMIVAMRFGDVAEEVEFGP